MKSFAYLLCVLCLVGCMAGARIKGGSLTHKGPVSQTVQLQSEDPKDRTGLNTEQTKSIEVLLPAGSTIRLDTLDTNAPAFVTLSSNTMYRMQVSDRVTSIVGASQKNVLGETIAKLSSMKWVTWLGAGVFLFGVATLFYPPLKLLISSITTSVAIAVSGLAVTILPLLVVGHELLIVGILGGGCLVYWFAHRHGSLSATVKTLKNS